MKPNSFQADPGIAFVLVVKPTANSDAFKTSREE
jgi:hypothetical protein